MAKKPGYDITLTVGSTDVGLTLAKDDNGRKIWQVRYAPTLAEQRYFESPSYANFPPEQELVWEQDSWHDGFGQWKFEEPNFYFEARNVDARHKGQLILGPLIVTTVVKDGDQAFLGVNTYPCAHTDGYLYVAFDQYIHRYDYPNDRWTEMVDFGAGETCTDLKSFGANVYAALGSGTKYFYGTGLSWTQSTLSDGYADKFSVVQQTLWKMLDNGELKSATDPTNTGSWTTATQVGDDNDPGRNLLTLSGRLIILKQTGAYAIDSAGNVIHLFNAPPSSEKNNYDAVYAFHNMGFLSTGNLGLQIYNQGFIDAIHPRRWGPKSTDAVGYARAFTDDGEYLYMSLLEGPLFAMRLQVIEGKEDFAWHPLWWDDSVHVADGTQVTSLIVHRNLRADGIRLWIFYAETTLQVGYFKLPGGSINPKTDPYSDWQYCASGTLTTGWMDWGMAAIDKAFYSVRLKTEALTANITIKVEYQIDDAAWATLATWTSNTDTHQFFSSKTGKRIRLRFTLATNSSATTPVLINFSLHGALRPTPKRIWDCVVEVADYQLKKDASGSTQQESATATQLHTAATTAWPGTLWDMRGASYAVTMLPTYPREISVEEDEKGRFVSQFQIMCIEAKTS